MEKNSENEAYVTHVYGRGAHHPRRSKVHDPYMHMKSPVKAANFRTKRALENVNASRVRSEKCQTSFPDDDEDVASPERPPPVSLPKKRSHGLQLQSVAISLGPPKILNNMNDPLVVPVTVTSTKVIIYIH